MLFTDAFRVYFIFKDKYYIINNYTHRIRLREMYLVTFDPIVTSFMILFLGNRANSVQGWLPKLFSLVRPYAAKVLTLRKFTV